ncbi:MAG TPA: hypothetical protein VF453_10280 [Burkholderiaceae bacterium]
MAHPPSRSRSARRAALAIATAATAAIAAAQPHGGHRPGGLGWHGDIRHFGDHDWHVWRGGRWVHGPHGGHPGWWWVVGPTWYFYPSPVYPYPDPYEPPPPWTVPMPAPPARFWYFCEESRSYYPYVATCPGGWKQVPAVQAPDASAPVQ